MPRLSEMADSADERHPARHLRGLMDLLTDADGALQALDRDLAGEETLDDLDDEERVLLVELPGGGDGLAEGEALDPDGRRNRSEAKAIFFGPPRVSASSGVT